MHNAMIAFLEEMVNDTLVAPSEYGDFRWIACDVMSKDGQIFDRELVPGVLDHMELAYLGNQLNFNNDREISRELDDYFNLFIPYVVYNYSGVNNVPPNIWRDITSDATKFARVRDNDRRELMNLYQREQRGGRGTFGSRAVGRNTGGGMLRNNDNRSGGYSYGGNHSNAPSRAFVDDNKGGSIFTPSSHVANTSGIPDFYAKNRQNNLHDYKPDNIRRQSTNQSDREAWDDLVDEGNSIDIRQVEEISPIRQSSSESSFSRQTDNKSSRIPDTYKANPNRSRGVNWFHHSIQYSNPNGTKETVSMNMISNPMGFIEAREKYCPRELFPIDVNKLSWDGNEAYIYHTYSDGTEVKEYIFTYSQSQPNWISWNPATHRCLIDIDEYFIPRQRFIELSKEEKMKIENHRIPGKALTDKLATTIVPYQKTEGDLSQQIASLQLSEEERRLQEIELLQADKLINDHIVAVVSEIYVDREADIADKVMEAVASDVVDGKLVEVPLYLKNVAYSKNQQHKLINSIKNCRTFEDYIRDIHHPLIGLKEYSVARNLSVLIDKQFNKLLVKMGFFHFTVDDVLLCYDEVLRYYIPDDKSREYCDHVENLFKTLVVDRTELVIPAEEMGRNTLTNMGSQHSVFYVNRLLSEFEITLPPKEAQQQPWLEVHKENDNEFGKLCRAIHYKQQHEAGGLGRDLFILTADGVLIETMIQDKKNLSKVLVCYRHFR